MFHQSVMARFQLVQSLPHDCLLTLPSAMKMIFTYYSCHLLSMKLNHPFRGVKNSTEQGRMLYLLPYTKSCSWQLCYFRETNHITTAFCNSELYNLEKLSILSSNPLNHTFYLQFVKMQKLVVFFPFTITTSHIKKYLLELG